jgi:hypothetical protein
MAAAIHSGGQLAGLVAPDAAGALLPELFDEEGDGDFEGDDEADLDGAEESGDESDVDDEPFEPAPARLSVR